MIIQAGDPIGHNLDVFLDGDLVRDCYKISTGPAGWLVRARRGPDGRFILHHDEVLTETLGGEVKAVSREDGTVFY